MIAPTEKHLEDWVVANPEKFFRAVYGGWGLEGWEFCVAARQLHLPTGIADLLLQEGSHLYVVEIKKGSVDKSALTQILRYIADLEAAVILAYDRSFTSEGSPFSHLPHEIWPRHIGYVSGILVGDSVSGKDVLNACRFGEWTNQGVSILTYDYDGAGNYQFEYPQRPTTGEDYNLQINHLLDTELGDVIQGIFWNELQKKGVRQ